MNSSWLAKPAVARIVGGDFNAEWPEIDAIAATSRWSYRDAYAAGNGPVDRATLSPRNPNSAAQGARCIDFLISLAGGDEEHPAFDEARVFGDGPLYPSHHFGVAVTALRMTGTRSKGEAVATSAP